MSAKSARVEIELKPLGEEAVPQLLELYRQCEDFLALGPQAHATEAMVCSDLELSKPYGGSYRGIFDASGQLLGVLDTIPNSFEGEAETAFIELLMIAAPFRGQGLGKQVFDLFVSELQGGPARKIKAGVQANNPFAIRFWEHQGFHAISEPAWQPDGTLAFMMECELW